MHGFQDAKILHALVGAQLIQVCVGVNEIIFHFAPETTKITVNSIETFYRENKNLVENVANKGVIFFDILGSRIISVVTHGVYRVDLVFSSGDKVTLTDDSERYESIILEVSGKTIVV